MSAQNTCAYIYDDGDYTHCAECNSAKHCTSKKTCSICGKTEGVFYDKKTDLFLCGQCYFSYTR